MKKSKAKKFFVIGIICYFFMIVSYFVADKVLPIEEINDFKLNKISETVHTKYDEEDGEYEVSDYYAYIEYKGENYKFQVETKNSLTEKDSIFLYKGKFYEHKQKILLFHSPFLFFLIIGTVFLIIGCVLVQSIVLKIFLLLMVVNVFPALFLFFQLKYF